jgi:hypothetical protein
VTIEYLQAAGSSHRVNMHIDPLRRVACTPERNATLSEARAMIYRRLPQRRATSGASPASRRACRLTARA